VSDYTVLRSFENFLCGFTKVKPQTAGKTEYFEELPIETSCAQKIRNFFAVSKRQSQFNQAE
jgi:hypothetical protein